MHRGQYIFWIFVLCLTSYIYLISSTADVKYPQKRINSGTLNLLGRDLSEKLAMHYDMSVNALERHAAGNPKTNRFKVDVADILPMVTEWLNENIIVRETITETETFFRRTTLTETATKTIFVQNDNALLPRITITQIPEESPCNFVFITLAEDPVTVYSPSIQYYSSAACDCPLGTGSFYEPIFLTEEPVTRTVFLKPDVSTLVPEAIILTEDPYTTTIQLEAITECVSLTLTESLVQTVIPPTETISHFVDVSVQVTLTEPARIFLSEQISTVTESATLTQDPRIIMSQLVSTLTRAETRSVAVPYIVTSRVTVSQDPRIIMSQLLSTFTLAVTQDPQMSTLTLAVTQDPQMSTLTLAVTRSVNIPQILSNCVNSAENNIAILTSTTLQEVLTRIPSVVEVTLVATQESGFQMAPVATIIPVETTSTVVASNQSPNPWAMWLPPRSENIAKRSIRQKTIQEKNLENKNKFADEMKDTPLEKEKSTHLLPSHLFGDFTKKPHPRTQQSVIAKNEKVENAKVEISDVKHSPSYLFPDAKIVRNKSEKQVESEKVLKESNVLVDNISNQVAQVRIAENIFEVPAGKKKIQKDIKTETKTDATKNNRIIDPKVEVNPIVASRSLTKAFATNPKSELDPKVIDVNFKLDVERKLDQKEANLRGNGFKSNNIESKNNEATSEEKEVKSN